MAKYTQQSIMYSMLKLLQDKPLDKITVKDICEMCEINRNTFYYYYNRKNDKPTGWLLNDPKTEAGKRIIPMVDASGV